MKLVSISSIGDIGSGGFSKMENKEFMNDDAIVIGMIEQFQMYLSRAMPHKIKIFL